jgi:hypothetical protein
MKRNEIYEWLNFAYHLLLLYICTNKTVQNFVKSGLTQFLKKHALTIFFYEGLFTLAYVIGIPTFLLIYCTGLYISPEDLVNNVNPLIESVNTQIEDPTIPPEINIGEPEEVSIVEEVSTKKKKNKALIYLAQFLIIGGALTLYGFSVYSILPFFK